MLRLLSQQHRNTGGSANVWLCNRWQLLPLFFFSNRLPTLWPRGRQDPASVSFNRLLRPPPPPLPPPVVVAARFHFVVLSPNLFGDAKTTSRLFL